MDEEIYSQDDVRAFQRVGEFLAWFSMLESNIDVAIIGALGVEDNAGQLLMTFVPFGKKCEFLNALISAEDAGLDAVEIKTAQKNLSSIRKLADTRNMVAHSSFTARGLE